MDVIKKVMKCICVIKIDTSICSIITSMQRIYVEYLILSYQIFLYWQLQSTVKQKQRRKIPALLVSRIFMYCCASVNNTKKNQRPCTHPFTAVISPKTLKNMADSIVLYISVCCISVLFRINVISDMKTRMKQLKS